MEKAHYRGKDLTGVRGSHRKLMPDRGVLAVSADAYPDTHSSRAELLLRARPSSRLSAMPFYPGFQVLARNYIEDMKRFARQPPQDHAVIAADTDAIVFR